MSAVLNCLKACSPSCQVPHAVVSWCGRSVQCIKDRVVPVYQRITACFRAVFDFIAKPFIRFNPEEQALLSVFQDPAQPILQDLSKPIVDIPVGRGKLGRVVELFAQMSRKEQKIFIDTLPPTRLQLLYIGLSQEKKSSLVGLLSLVQRVYLMQRLDFKPSVAFFNSLDPKGQADVFYSDRASIRHQALIGHLTDDVCLRLFDACHRDEQQRLFEILSNFTQAAVLRDSRWPAIDRVAMLRMLPLVSQRGEQTAYEMFNNLPLSTQVQLGKAFASKESLLRYLERIDHTRLSELIRQLPLDFRVAGYQLLPLDQRITLLNEVLNFPQGMEIQNDVDHPERRFVCPIGFTWMRDPVCIHSAEGLAAVEDPQVGDLAHVPRPVGYFERAMLREALGRRPNINPLTNENHTGPVIYADAPLLQAGLYRHALTQRGV